jgi:acyl-CoA synthetase (AMP-forming)/AMP-acid ligase II
VSAHPSPSCLVEGLWQHADRAPEEPALVFIAEDGQRTHVTAGELRAAAERCAAGLAAAGVRAGDVVVLAIGHSRDLIDTLLGAGAIGAVPAIAPYFTGRLDAQLYAERVARMVAGAAARLVVASADLAARIGELRIDYDVATIADVAAGGNVAAPALLDGDALAYLQFTSGSTGAQKAVAHTQRAMRAYVAAKVVADAITPDDVAVSWLPLYHDLGLLSGLLTPLDQHVPTVLMSPAHWVRDPKILLWAISEFRGTVTWMPNFGLSHCAKAVRARDIEGVDLSSLKTLVSGGEMVRWASQQEFFERFAPYGLRTTVLQAGYGMAENIEGITTSPKGNPLSVDWVDQRELQRSRRAVPLAVGAPGATPIVACGIPMPGTEVRIVDADGMTVPERTVGEIEARSPYLLSGGYYRAPELTAEARRDGWLRTGDLGYFAGSLLHPCGRKKDLIIVGGHNVMPEDLEALAGDVPGVASGRVVAFGVVDERIGTERLAIVCELRDPGTGVDVRAIEREIRARVVRQLDVAVGEIRFVERGWIIKTSSGKLARSANREKHLAEAGART